MIKLTKKDYYYLLTVLLAGTVIGFLAGILSGLLLYTFLKLAPTFNFNHKVFSLWTLAWMIIGTFFSGKECLEEFMLLYDLKKNQSSSD